MSSLAESAPLNFDFVQDKTLRDSLTSDFGEMSIAYANGAWKATMVLGGSIVEALLIDHLLAEKKCTQKEAESLSFENLIKKAYDSKLISERVKQQAYLVKYYRNLIHGGRVLRTQEPCDENSAMTSMALVRMAVTENAKMRIESYGPTAAQVYKKLLDDPKNRAAQTYLLKLIKQVELVALLTIYLPEGAIELAQEDWDPFTEEVSLTSTEAVETTKSMYRRAFAQGDSETKTAAIKHLADVIKNERQDVVSCQVAWFLTVDMLQYAEPNDVEMICDYLLDHMEKERNRFSALKLKGIISYVNKRQILTLIAFLASVVSDFSLGPKFREDALEVLTSEASSVPEQHLGEFKSLMKKVVLLMKRDGHEDIAESLAKIDVRQKGIQLNESL